MITLAECKAHLSECQALGTDPNISVRRATAIMAIAVAWGSVARAVAEYEVI
jgi:hypothetical protein